MTNLMELLEKEKWAVHKCDSAHWRIEHGTKQAEEEDAFNRKWYEEHNYSPEEIEQLMKDYRSPYYTKYIAKAQAEFDEAAQEVREIRKQIKEHIAMIMAID